MKYDLILVGTGFSSTLFLKKYLEKSDANKKVLVIERGLVFKHLDRVLYAQGKPPSYHKQIEDPRDSVNNQNKAKLWVFALYHGGGSNCWWGCTPRFMPNDFALKTLYGVGADWPLTYNELEKYYTEAEQIMGISGPADTPFQRSAPYPLPPHVFSTVDRKMKAAFGNQWINQPTARASQMHGKRGACCSNYSCYICPMNAKFTIENTVNDVYSDPRVELIHGMQVFKVEFENNIAKRVICTDTQNRSVNNTKSFDGEVIVLGANAIFNAHILLNSGDDHPLTGAGISEQRGFFANILIDMDNVGGSSSITANGYMEYDGAFRKESASCLIENHNGPFIRNERGKWRKMARFKFLLEAIPDKNNRVTLSEDPFKPNIEYGEDSEYVKKGKKRIEENLKKIAAPLPVEDFHVSNFESTESHVLASVRMGRSISDSVVDKHQIHHKYRNLFVLGGSSFPSIAAANPTLTISALALLSADANF